MEHIETSSVIVDSGDGIVVTTSPSASQIGKWFTYGRIEGGNSKWRYSSTFSLAKEQHASILVQLVTERNLAGKKFLDLVQKGIADGLLVVSAWSGDVYVSEEAEKAWLPNKKLVLNSNDKSIAPYLKKADENWVLSTGKVEQVGD